MCGIEIDLVFASGSNLTSCAGDKIDFGFVRGPKINWFSFIDRNWLNFKRGDRNWLGLCVRAENDLFLVGGSIYLIFVRVVEIDLVWFSHAGRKSLGFSVSIELDFVFVRVVEFHCWGSKLTWFQCRDRIWFGFGGGEDDLVLVFGSKLPWF